MKDTRDANGVPGGTSRPSTFLICPLFTIQNRTILNPFWKPYHGALYVIFDFNLLI